LACDPQVCGGIATHERFAKSKIRTGVRALGGGGGGEAAVTQGRLWDSGLTGRLSTDQYRGGMHT